MSEQPTLNRREMLSAAERHAEHISACHGLDARHLLLAQTVRQLVAACRASDARIAELEALVKAQMDRIGAQSEVLSRRAEGAS